MANTYDDRDRTQPMLGGGGLFPSRQNLREYKDRDYGQEIRNPIRQEEMDVQVHTPIQQRDYSQFRGPREHIRRREVVYESNYIPFRSILTPMTGLNATSSDNGPKIKFEIIRDHLTKLTTLQWEPFQGSVSSSGTDCLEVQQSISHLPEYPVDLTVVVEVKGIRKIAFIRIDPFSTTNIKFFLDITGSGSSIAANDRVFVPGGCVQWKSAD